MNLPTAPDEIEARYLPSLNKSWREATIALSEDDEVIAFAVIGPEWQTDDRAFLDLFAIVHPFYADGSISEALAADLEHRLHIQHLQAPRKKLSLRARSEDWFACAPNLALRLGLVEEDDEEDEDEAD